MRSTTTLKQVVLVLLLVAACISLGQGLKNAIVRHDGSKDNQWAPSRALLEHTDPYKAYLDAKARSSFFLCQAPNYPASGLILLWPYAVWEWPTAKTLWAVSNVLFTAIILSCLFRLLPPDATRITKLLITTLFLMGTPWRNGVGNGQHALFTLAFFLLAVVVLPRSAKGSAIPLAVSWFKYTISFPLSLYFARSRRGWAAIAVAAAIHATLTIFASIWTHTSPLGLLLGPLKVAQCSTGIGQLDVFAIAAEIGFSSKLLPGLIALAILGITYAALRRDHDTLSCLSTLSIASMTVCFHGGYDFVVLVIPLGYAICKQAKTARAQYYLLAIASIWFVDKAVYVLSNQALFVSPVYFWLKALLFYSVLCADWVNAFASRVFESRGLFVRPESFPNHRVGSDEE